MKKTQTIYVDFNRFVTNPQNRDLLASGVWQRNVQFLAAAVKATRLSNSKAFKSARRL